MFKKRDQTERKKNGTKKQKTASPGVDFGLSARSSNYIHTYIHTYFIGSSPRGFSELILHYKIINQVHDKNITMIKEDKGQ